MATANVYISNMSSDLPSIAKTAGNGDVDARWVSEDRLYVNGVTQEALEAALAAYNHDAFVDNRATIALRAERDKLLAESDWTQFSDVTISNREAWKTYRQTLRDLPASTADPKSPSWPAKPE